MKTEGNFNSLLKDNVHITPYPFRNCCVSGIPGVKEGWNSDIFLSPILNSSKESNALVENQAINMALTGSSSKNILAAPLKLYNDFPKGTYFHNFRGTLVSREAQGLMKNAIVKMKGMIYSYGENSTVVKEKTWIEHFKDQIRYTDVWGTSVGEDYLFMLYSFSLLVYSKDYMTLSVLNSLEAYFEIYNSINFDYDNFYLAVKFIAGLVGTRMGITGENFESYFMQLKDYYERDEMERFAALLNLLLDEFSTFLDQLVSSKGSLTLAGGVDEMVPCSVYIEKMFNPLEDLEINLYFEVFNKKFHLQFYYWDIFVDTNYVLTVPVMYLLDVS